MVSAINHIIQKVGHHFISLRVCEGIDVRIVSSACTWYR